MTLNFNGISTIKQLGMFTLPTTHHLLLSQAKREEPWTIQLCHHCNISSVYNMHIIILIEILIAGCLAWGMLKPSVLCH